MFKNTHELITTIWMKQLARNYYEQERWNSKPVCPYCGCDHYVYKQKQ